MSWNPNTYNKFKTERFAPFYDCLQLIRVRPDMAVIDLGCGTGELTRKLADTLSNAQVVGIDSSAEMLTDSDAFANERVSFVQRTIDQQVSLDAKWDLVFSNAAIQWVDNHETLLPSIIGMLKPGGQIVIQMPSQNHNLTNQLLNQLADEEPFRAALHHWQRTSPVLSIDRYAHLLFERGSTEQTVFEKIYPLVVPDADALFDWVSGTALLPYLDRLDSELKQQFIAAYKHRLRSSFTKLPVFYPFKRILMAATFH